MAAISMVSKLAKWTAGTASASITGAAVAFKIYNEAFLQEPDKRISTESISVSMEASLLSAEPHWPLTGPTVTAPAQYLAATERASPVIESATPFNDSLSPIPEAISPVTEPLSESTELLPPVSIPPEADANPFLVAENEHHQPSRGKMAVILVRRRKGERTGRWADIDM